MYTNIADKELVQYHKKIKVNKSFKLTEILANEDNLFLVKEHSNNIFGIIPLFNCETITSSNPNDRVFDNEMVLCIYDEETVISFITNRQFQDFSILSNLVEKWGKKILYGVVYEKYQVTPLADASIVIELFDNDVMVNTILETSNNNGEFVYFITNNYTKIKITVTYENITHMEEI